jgi:methionine-rich copper-binding protein CopC
MAQRMAQRVVAVVVMGFVTLVLGAAPAFAHTRLQGSDPADGATVATAPQRVSLTFNESLSAEFSAITVVGPDSAAYQTGAVAADGTTISTAVRPLGPAGRYEIGYRVVSDDGHPVSGTVAFTLTAPGPGGAEAPGGAVPQAAQPSEPAPAAAQPPAVAPASGDAGSPVWPWLVGAVVLVVVGVGVALRAGRS